MRIPPKPLAILLAAFPLVAFGQETKLNTVVVTAPPAESRSGADLGNPDLAPMRATTSDAAGLLRDVPGVSLYGAGRRFQPAGDPRPGR